MSETKPHGKAIIEALGGVPVVAQISGKGVRVVYIWAKTGVIPEEVRPKLVEYAVKNGKRHHPFDYVAHLMPLVTPGSVPYETIKAQSEAPPK